MTTRGGTHTALTAVRSHFFRQSLKLLLWERLALQRGYKRAGSWVDAPC